MKHSIFTLAIGAIIIAIGCSKETIEPSQSVYNSNTVGIGARLDNRLDNPDDLEDQT